MANKPKRASEYSSDQVALVRSTCLYVATRLGDLMDDVVVIGGLVPSLLIDQRNLPEGVSTHVGTMDLDVGLKLALLDHGRYHTLTERLREAQLTPDQTEEGRPTRQRWQVGTGSVTVDFLIPPSLPGDKGGSLRNIEKDFAAIIAPGLKLAFQDRRRVRIEGKTIFGENAARDLWVCGPGAFVVLKALAFLGRGENKDAYDLYYLIRNFGSSIEATASCLRPLLEDDEAKKAIQVLRNDFLDIDGVGPRRVAEFLQGGPNDEIQADVVGADGYEPYQIVARAGPDGKSKYTLAFCWAHVRRKFVKCEPFAPTCAEVIDLIGELYGIERDLPNPHALAGEEQRQALARILEVRAERSAPVVAKIKEWAERQHGLPEGTFRKSINYMQGLWSGLIEFLTNPWVPLDNNLVERQIRPLVVGRKNQNGN